MANGFDKLSRFYDVLVRLVYGRALFRAQTCFLSEVKPQSRILIIGGGTGWFLEEILGKTNPSQVVYVDLSANMLAKSINRIQKKLPEQLGQVDFVQGDFREVFVEGKFDLVCTHFFLDMFEGEAFQEICQRIEGFLRPEGEWYFSDFHYPPRFPMSWIGGFQIRLMYWFFRKICNIEARRLPPFFEGISEQNFQMDKERFFYGKLIRAIWWSRKEQI